MVYVLYLSKVFLLKKKKNRMGQDLAHWLYFADPLSKQSPLSPLLQISSQFSVNCKWLGVLSSEKKGTSCQPLEAFSIFPFSLTLLRSSILPVPLPPPGSCFQSAGYKPPQICIQCDSSIIKKSVKKSKS